MKLLKRKDSCTFKREIPLAIQERIYPANDFPAFCSFCSCAASRTGIASAANKVIAVLHVKILDFMLPPLGFVCGVG